MLQKLEYQQHAITFDFGNEVEMINATEMAKIFDQRVAKFLEAKETTIFLRALQEEITGFKVPNSDFETSEKVLKTVRGGRNSGTWMHRLLALKFAAWLDPYFELWIYRTIDSLLFGKVKIRQDLLYLSTTRSQLIKQINLLEQELTNNTPYNNLQSLKKDLSTINKKINKLLEEQHEVEFLFE